MYWLMMKPNSATDDLYVIIESIFSAIGVATFCEACAYGKGGASSGVAATEALWLLLLEVIFMGDSLTDI